jgi:hypothetical protein
MRVLLYSGTVPLWDMESPKETMRAPDREESVRKI